MSGPRGPIWIPLYFTGGDPETSKGPALSTVAEVAGCNLLVAQWILDKGLSDAALLPLSDQLLRHLRTWNLKV